MVRFLQQRVDPLLQDRDDVDLGVGPGRLDRLDGGLGPDLVVTEVRLLVGEEFLHLGVGHRMLDRAVRRLTTSATDPGSNNRPSPWPRSASHSRKTT